MNFIKDKIGKSLKIKKICKLYQYLKAHNSFTFVCKCRHICIVYLNWYLCGKAICYFSFFSIFLYFLNKLNIHRIYSTREYKNQIRYKANKKDERNNVIENIKYKKKLKEKDISIYVLSSILQV